MTETPLSLGADGRLLGVLTEPVDPAESAPIVLLLNAGLVHHVGPNRLNVELSRTLAEHGFKSLRFDLAGIGDSPRSIVDRPYEEQAAIDIIECMDDLERRGFGNRFVAIGLCTGADNALNAASQDGRIDGCTLIDGRSFETRRYRTRENVIKATQAWRWKRFIARKLRRTPQEPQETLYDELVFQPVRLTKAQYESQLESLMSRHGSLLMVYTGYGPQPYNYRDQFFDVFPDRRTDDIEVEYLPHATHTFTRRDHRDLLISMITGWMESHFGDMSRTHQPSA